jgi:two-component SAPR family response regulator
VHQLREVLGGGVGLRSHAGGVSLARSPGVSSESARFEALLAEAARLQGDERLDATMRALAIAERGEYLPGIAGAWVEERRERLAMLVADARQDAAELAFAAGRYAETERLVAAILEHDALREGAHRLEMRIANATGD